MIEVQQNGQQPNSQPPNWNIPVFNPMMAWMTNPYMMYWGQRFGNPQGVQNEQPVQNNNQNPNPQKLVIPCGVVNDQNEILPADIPMDKGFGMFLRKDLKEIYIKQWGQDGRINTKKYVEEIQEVPVSTELSAQDVLNQTNERFTMIEKAIISLTNSLNEHKKGSFNQKALKKMEVDVDG